MPDIVIRAEGLGKKYVIGHESQRKGQTFRDVITGTARSVLRKAGDMIHGRPVIQGDELEEVWALRDVSFEVKRGEVLGIIGRNGAGKSTLLKILSRITEPTYGRVSIRGRVSSLLEVGTGFHPELTGRENVFLNGAILGMTRGEVKRKFDEIVNFAEIDKFIDTPVKRYSSGMYVRLAFAVAAHLDPEVLIIDEVLAVGDAAFQKRCLGKIEDVATRHERTVLFVSHNMNAVQTLCQRAIWMDHGSSVRDGSAASVINQYLISNFKGTAERIWVGDDRPGDDRVRLFSARIRQGGRLTSLVDINEPARIELEFEVLRHCQNLVAGCNFYNAAGICLFAHCDWRPNRLAPGRYRKHVSIPPQLFAEGGIQILVQLVFYEPMVISVSVPNALSCEAVDSDSCDSVRGPYTGTWPGLIRVNLKWSEAEQVIG